MMVRRDDIEKKANPRSVWRTFRGFSDFRTIALRVTRGSEILAPHPFSQKRSRIIAATTCFDDTGANIADRVSQKTVDKREAQLVHERYSRCRGNVVACKSTDTAFHGEMKYSIGLP